MKKRLLKIAITTALATAFAVPVFANPFSDVPAKHWAYGAVTKLAQEGIIDGYNDGTFRGDKTVTRYEMAQIIAKAMNKNLNPEQKTMVNKLAREFSDELTSMNVKIDGMQNQMDNMVKISGDARVRFFSTEHQKDVTDYRARVTFDGHVNDNMKFNARLTSGSALSDAKASGISLDTANVSFNALGFANTVGRQDIRLGSGFLMDTQMNGIATKIGGLKMFGGNASSNAVVDTTKNAAETAYLNGANGATVWNRVYGAEYSTNLLGANVTADYLKNTTSQDNIYGANAGFKLFHGVSANAEYFKNSGTGKNDASATAYGVKFDKLGLSATYRNVKDGAMSPFSTMVTSTTTQYNDLASGFKGMEYQYDKNLDKNTDLTVKYQDFKDQAGAKLDARTSAVINVKF